MDSIKKFIYKFEKDKDSFLEQKETLQIEKNIKASDKIDEKSENDIKFYMNEFRFEYFEILEIKKYP